MFRAERKEKMKISRFQLITSLDPTSPQVLGCCSGILKTLGPQLRLPECPPTRQYSSLGPSFSEWHLHPSPPPELPFHWPIHILTTLPHASLKSLSPSPPHLPTPWTINSHFSLLSLEDSNSLLFDPCLPLISPFFQVISTWLLS